MNQRTENINHIIEGLSLSEDVGSQARRNRMMKSGSSHSSSGLFKSFGGNKKDYVVMWQEKTMGGDGKYQYTDKSKVISAKSRDDAIKMAEKALKNTNYIGLQAMQKK